MKTDERINHRKCEFINCAKVLRANRRVEAKISIKEKSQERSSSRLQRRFSTSIAECESKHVFSAVDYVKSTNTYEAATVTTSPRERATHLNSYGKCISRPESTILSAFRYDL